MKATLPIFFIVIFTQWLTAQSSDFQFHHITEKDGLSENEVNCMLKDKQGGVWIGTNNGLNFYDGTHFSVFRHTADSNSILNNTIMGLFQDRDGNIWGGTELGVFCFNRKQNKFRNYLTPASVDRVAWNVIVDKNGTVWANGWYGISRLNRSTKKLERVALSGPAFDSMENHKMRRNCILEDPSGKGFWLATRAGIKYYDKKNGHLDDATNQPNNSLFRRSNVAPLVASAKGYFWYFDNGTKELIAFSPQTRAILKRISVRDAVPYSSCLSIFESSDGKIWFGTANNQVFVVDTQQGNIIQRLDAENRNDFNIAGNLLFGAMEDSDGSVWLGTVGGISKWNGTRSLYRVHKLSKNIPALQDARFITLLVEDTTNASWWLTTSGEQLIHYNPASGAYQVYDPQKNIAAGIQKRPTQISGLSLIDGKVIICTFTGAWELNSKTGKFSPYRPLPPPFTNFESNTIVSADNIHVYHAGIFGVIYHNRQTNEAVLLPNISATTLGIGASSNYLSIRNQSPAYMAPGPGWLMSYNKQQVDSINYMKDQATESHGYILWIEPGKDHSAWVVCYGIGVYHCNFKDKSVKLYTQADGLTDNHISIAMPDEFGNVWCANRYKYSILIPKTGYFYNFTLPLSQQNAYWSVRMALLKNKHIIASASSDVVEFFPERLQQLPDVRKPIISSANIAGKMSMLWQGSSLRLSPTENALNLHFGILTDPELFPYAFYYQLEGYDKDWQQADDRNEVFYSKLPPGNYTFRVKAVAKNQLWASPEETLQIFIAKPFYQTLWFRLLAVLAFATILYVFYRYRLYQQKQILTLETKAESLEKEKAMIQYESLKQHLNPHFLFNSLTSLRSLIKTDSKTAAWFLDGLSKVYRYVLKSADQELVFLQDEAAYVMTFAALQKVRFGEGLQVSINIEAETKQKHIAPVVLQNLVENAIKHNTTSTESPLVVEIFSEGDRLLVRNNLQRYRLVETSNKQGLHSLKKLYSFYTDEPVLITENDKYFTVSIPLL